MKIPFVATNQLENMLISESFIIFKFVYPDFLCIFSFQVLVILEVNSEFLDLSFVGLCESRECSFGRLP